MRTPIVVCAFLVSSAILALEVSGVAASSLEPCSRVGWMGLVWCAALTFAGGRQRPWTTPGLVALALPLFALGVAGDVSAGAALGPRALLALGALAVFAAWSHALERVAASVWLGAAVWGVCGLAMPLLVAALEWGAADEAARAPRGLAWCAAASPLAWCQALAAGELAPGWRGAPFAPLAAAALTATLGPRLAVRAARERGT